MTQTVDPPGYNTAEAWRHPPTISSAEVRSE